MDWRESRKRKAEIMKASRERRGLIRNKPQSRERLDLLEAACRERAAEKGREFYYFPRKCKAGHSSKRFVIDGSCYKCSLTGGK